MDGFSVIPVENSNSNNKPSSASTDIVIDTEDRQVENKEVVPESKSSSILTILYMLSYASFFGVVGYFLYLVFVWNSSLMQIGEYSQMMTLEKEKLNKAELEEFVALDKSLKVLNTKFANHVLYTQVLNTINSHLRTNLILTDYKIENKDSEVEIVFTSAAPSMKELAEQSQRFFNLKRDGIIKSYSVSNISIETDGRRLKFIMKVSLDKKNVGVNSFLKNITR